MSSNWSRIFQLHDIWPGLFRKWSDLTIKVVGAGFRISAPKFAALFPGRLPGRKGSRRKAAEQDGKVSVECPEHNNMLGYFSSSRTGDSLPFRRTILFTRILTKPDGQFEQAMR